MEEKFEGTGRYTKAELLDLVESWIDENDFKFFDADTALNNEVLVIRARKRVCLCTFESECSSQEDDYI